MGAHVVPAHICPLPCPTSKHPAIKTNSILPLDLKITERAPATCVCSHSFSALYTGAVTGGGLSSDVTADPLIALQTPLCAVSVCKQDWTHLSSHSMPLEEFMDIASDYSTAQHSTHSQHASTEQYTMHSQHSMHLQRSTARIYSTAHHALTAQHASAAQHNMHLQHSTACIYSTAHHALTAQHASTAQHSMHLQRSTACMHSAAQHAFTAQQSMHSQRSTACIHSGACIWEALTCLTRNCLVS